MLADEGPVRRLDIISLITARGRLNTPETCGYGQEDEYANCRILLALDSGSAGETTSLIRAHISAHNFSVKPVSDDIPIVQLVPSQRVEMKYHVRL